MEVLTYRFAAIKIDTICPLKVGKVLFDVGREKTPFNINMQMVSFSTESMEKRNNSLITI